MSKFYKAQLEAKEMEAKRAKDEKVKTFFY